MPEITRFEDIYMSSDGSLWSTVFFRSANGESSYGVFLNDRDLTPENQRAVYRAYLIQCLREKAGSVCYAALF